MRVRATDEDENDPVMYAIQSGEGRGRGIQSGEGRGWGTQRRGGASSQIRERARFMVAVFVSAL